MRRLLGVVLLLLGLPGIHSAETDVPTSRKVDIAALQQQAEAGDPYAQMNMGAAYDHGMGVARDMAQALYWYRLAAEQGVPEAQLSLGHLYAVGDGVGQDYGYAAGWLEKAAAQGLADACYLLGVMYAEGLGVAVDKPRARGWLEQAAVQGHEAAAEYLQNPGNW